LIPQTFIQDLLNRIDIVDVVGRHVQLKKGGANFMGLCPFHNEKSPSFTVSPTKQFYHCFGCGAHGSAIGFLMEYSGQPFVEAVKDLAHSVAMQVPEDDRFTPTERAERQAQSMALTDLLGAACQFYRQTLRSSQKAIAYLKGRGVTGEIAARFGLGYAPDAWQGLEEVFENYADDRLIEAGLVIANDEGKRYDRFRDRVMFPIRNTKGQVVGFGGRVLGEGEPKYLNSPETPVFSKGSELYGLFEARQAIREAGYVVVVEGYMDVVALAQLGFAQAVATLGTATTPFHVQKLLRHADEVVFSFDGDAAGRKAAWRALEASLPHAADNKAIRFLFLPPEHDPDSFVREQGASAFEDALKGALPLSAFFLRELAARNDLSGAEGRAKCQFEAKPLLLALPPGALRLQILRGLAELTGGTPAEIESFAGLSKPSRALGPRAKPRVERRMMTPLTARVLALLAADPGLADEIPQAQLERFAADEALLPVSALVDLIHASGARNAGALAEEARESPYADTWNEAIQASVRQPLIEQAELRAELLDALRQLELARLGREIDELSRRGLSTPGDRERFSQLEADRRRLKQGPATTS
jgi:DNA primase